MTDQHAPFFNDVATAQSGARAIWTKASDGIRLRLALWRTSEPSAKGTVLIFPGRTEFVEKYAETAQTMVNAGFDAIAIDWRGQGLSDRLADDPLVGHVARFSDYQLDVAAMLDAARAEGMPEPYYLIGHSMGGGIGFDTLTGGTPINAAAFSGPMWGIYIAPHMRPIAWALSWGARQVGQNLAYAPGTGPANYAAEAPFEDNTLTSDPDMFALMKQQLAAHPELTLGGPSLHWLNEALKATRRIRATDAPPVATVTYLGANERIVDTPPVHNRMNHWADSNFEVVQGAEHEVLMEKPEIRHRVLSEIATHFTNHP